MKGNVGEWFFGFRNDAMVGQNRVGYDVYVPLRHVAARTVVRWRLVLSQG